MGPAHAESGTIRVSGVTLGKAMRAADAEIAADVLHAITVGLNADYLADAINAASADSVAIMAVGDGESPVDFEPAAQRADIRKVCRVMPMRLDVLAARAVAAE